MKPRRDRPAMGDGGYRHVAAAVLVIFGGLSCAAAEELDGQPIVRINVDRADIFDLSNPKTSSWFYRWGNALHIVSKEGFIRQMLLFGEGEPYASHLAEESARILRGLGYLNPVEITARPVDGGVEVDVYTHDQWTLLVGLSLGLIGNRESLKVEFEERNFLGWGKKLVVGWSSDIERTTWRYIYEDPNVFGSRWRTRLRFENLSDGQRQQVLAERPFFALATRWAWGADWWSEELIEYLYAESESAVSGDRRSRSLQAWFGRRLPGARDATRRLLGGWDYQNHEFKDWTIEASGAPYPTPENRLVSGPRVGYQQVANRFLVLRGYRAWIAQEDVALGPTIDAGVTYSNPELGGDIERLLFDGRFTKAWRLDGWMLSSDSRIEGRLDEGTARNWVVASQFSALQLGTRGWQLRVLAEASHELDLDRQLTLGADIGLRGWNPDFFDGTGRALANFQWRTLVKEDFLHLMSLGVVVFADTGVTWDPRVGRATEGLRTDVGVGLLADLTHIGLANLFRVEVAWPDDNSGATFTITSSALF